MWSWVRCPLHLNFSALRQLSVTSCLILWVACTEIASVGGPLFKILIFDRLLLFLISTEGFHSLQWLSTVDILNSAVQAIICHAEIELDEMTDRLFLACFETAAAVRIKSTAQHIGSLGPV